MIKLPDFLKPIPAQEDDPPQCQNYFAIKQDNFNLFVRHFPIPTQYANPYDEKKTIDAIHQSLDSDQGLIEVEKGQTKKGLVYISAITKNYMGPQNGVQYFLRVNFAKSTNEEWSEEIDAFFGEEGVTGQRDAMIMAMLGAQIDWMEDPYDKSFTKGIRMNKSEDKKYDDKFPYHPLTQARKFLDYLRENN